MIAKILITAGSMAGISIALPNSLTIGKGKGCNLQLGDDGIAELHCQIYRQNDGFFVKNLESEEKTFVNDKAVHDHPLSVKDCIRIGSVRMEFCAEEEHQPIKTHFADKEDEFDMPEAIEDDPRKIGDYIILDHLGTGATGDVFKAENFTTHEVVALKILHAQDIDKHILKRFIQEVQICSKFDHPKIVKVYEFGMFKGRPLIAMEYIEGISLEEFIKEYGSLTAVQALRTAGQIAQALHYTHQQGVVHRDLKPSNILLQNKENIKIIDFGVIKVYGNSITFANQMIGTVRYIPPEQIDDASSVDERADIYSLGAIMYFLVSGKPPFFDIEGIESLILNINARKLTPLKKLVPNIPSEFQSIVRKAMHRKIEKRYPNITAMFRDIIEALQTIENKSPS
ncbi:FHA domain-containing serine/threonine-protein kinase [Candidatus Uabimicrobium amorphum]|uniref:Putative serine/threonine-protein kinase PknB n=1 Tax=Uabimicrobium amorphum TaxID=2596890 RepID=A0A5S9F1R6_UABAM|nr:FHA domain-containing serine/threonine-protein kinase [Candidatus Uabimicrobium amorphum]BBM82897.1 putative serine/threonine-protein kinase PknB [Candidatus Uabimicrobium amorphum]